MIPSAPIGPRELDRVRGKRPFQVRRARLTPWPSAWRRVDYTAFVWRVVEVLRVPTGHGIADLCQQRSSTSLYGAPRGKSLH